MQSEDEQEKHPDHIETVDKCEFVHFDIRGHRVVSDILSWIPKNVFHTGNFLVSLMVRSSKRLEFKSLFHLDVDLAIKLGLGVFVHALRQIEYNKRGEERFVANEDVLFNKWIQKLKECHEYFTIEHEEIHWGELSHFVEIIKKAAGALLFMYVLHKNVIDRVLLNALFGIKMKKHVDVLLQRQTKHFVSTPKLLQGIQNPLVRLHHLAFGKDYNLIRLVFMEFSENHLSMRWIIFIEYPTGFHVVGQDLFDEEDKKKAPCE